MMRPLTGNSLPPIHFVHSPSAESRRLDFDDDYRLVLSKTIREHVPSESLKQHFLSKEGQPLELPKRYQPLREYLEHHRKGGAF